MAAKVLAERGDEGMNGFLDEWMSKYHNYKVVFYVHFQMLACVGGPGR
jgi:hypothetical protein